MSELEGRTAVVTGGASGIGAACARELSARGALVTVADLDDAGATAVADEIGGKTWAIDLSDVSALEELRLETDILVNNAGIQHVSPIADFPPDRFRFMLALMVEAPFLLIRAALPHMYDKGFGRIINISSVHGLRASEYKVAYVTAKHALEGLSKVTALEGGAARCHEQLRQPRIRAYTVGGQADCRSGPYPRHPRTGGRGKRSAEGERDQTATGTGRGRVVGGLACLARRRDGDRRLLLHGRRLERTLTATS